MTWAEFRQWAWDRYGYRVKGGHSRMDSAWRPIIGLSRAGYSGQHANANAGTGSGYPFEYELEHQRRFALWLKARDLLSLDVLYDWLDRAEDHTDGWLVNDGSGIRWLAHPETEAHELASKGFVAIKCGL